ncbi:protein-disulfide reductase DsbD domain-containing protein [Maritimibacter sp. UBA3975]|uniref:protein-disulfide reductase DsbD domain-containing protein n=1 Tax=Maritimibacter sp. UBA3975 TaxID=1946833 RepID=UPI0025B9CE09|nr:protein-disulfide reductase DsbD domain-containing protein [Maritimibacter sp. UBA3975]
MPLFAALLVSAAPVVAEPAPAQVTLLPGWRMDNGHHMAALRVTLDDGWKTYWRAPGEGGIPPEVDWSQSVNVAGVTYHWPVPEVISRDDMTTIGYKHELILPLELTPAQAGDPIHIDADILVGICEEICVPLEAQVDAVLNDTDRDPDPVIERALAARPDTAGEAGVVTASCTREDLSDGVRVTARLDMPAIGADEIVVMEADNPTIWVSEAVSVRDGAGHLVAHADFVPPNARPFEMTSDDLRLTVIAAGRAVDIDGCDLSD